MSICRENYSNSGSYLRSRGYDQQICSLVSDLNNGSVVLGTVVPSQTTGVTLKGIVNINQVSLPDGYLKVNGGRDNDTSTFSIQGNKGMRLTGPIVQTKGTSTFEGDNSYNDGNVFRGKQHVFTNDDGSSNLLICGSIYTFGEAPAVTRLGSNTSNVSISTNSTDNAGIINLNATTIVTDRIQLTFTKPFSEKPVVNYSTEYAGYNLDFSASNSMITWYVRTADFSGNLHYQTIGLKN